MPAAETFMFASGEIGNEPLNLVNASPEPYGIGRVKAVAKTSLAELPESRAVAEHLMGDDHQHVILRHVERQKFSGSIKDAERERRPAALCPELARAASDPRRKQSDVAV